MKILSIGFGFIGKAYSIYLREAGHDVYVLTIKDKTYQEARKYNFTEPTGGGRKNFDAAVIAVPTPTINGKFDLSILSDAVAKAATYSKNIIIKSTIVPGTTKLFAEKYPGIEFYFYPEFLEANHPIRDTFNQKIVVFGNDKWTDKKRKFIIDLFKFKDAEFTDWNTAENLKYFHNIWLSANISLWNSFIRTAPKADANFILKQVHKSDYFGRHPWKIGVHYDGACLPKDIQAYTSNIKKNSVYKKLFVAIEDVNNEVINEGDGQNE